MKKLLEYLNEAHGRRFDLAKDLSINPSSITKWVNRKQVPAERVLEVERLTGVSRHELRPDIYPRGIKTKKGAA